MVFPAVIGKAAEYTCPDIPSPRRPQRARAVAARSAGQRPNLLSSVLTAELMTTPLAWILVLVTAGSVGALVYMLLQRRKPDGPDLPKEWSLTQRPVFSAHERRVHRQLREALPLQVILAKLPLVRFCHPTDPNQVRYWFDLLGAIHVSFAVCSPNGRVLAAIDLEEGHGPARRSILIKQAVLAACHIRYVRYPTTHTPSVPELQLLVPAAAAATATASLAPPPTNGAVVHTGFGPAFLGDGAASRQPSRPSHWPAPDSGFRKDSSFGRDSVISSFSHSLPSVLPERSGEVVDTPPTRH